VNRKVSKEVAMANYKPSYVYEWHIETASISADDGKTD
jgi:hypothetical protein